MYNLLDDIEAFIEMLSRGVIPGEDGQPLLAEQELIERIKSALFYSMMKRQCGTFPIPGITAPAVTNYTVDKHNLATVNVTSDVAWQPNVSFFMVNLGSSTLSVSLLVLWLLR